MEIKQLKGGSYQITQTIKDKPYTFSVIDCNIDPNKEYNFRVVSKCKAGYMTIHEMKATIYRVVTAWKPGHLQTVEMEHTWHDGTRSYITVLAMKNNRFFRVDRQILESLKVGDIYHTFRAMQDLDHWQRIGSTTYNSPAYGDIVKLAQQPMYVEAIYNGN